jgi:hypothetical protein
MSESDLGEPVNWYFLPAEDAENLLIVADRLSPGETLFPVAVRVVTRAKLSPARIAAALRRIAEGIETRCAAFDAVDASWCLEIALPEPGEEWQGLRPPEGSGTMEDGGAFRCGINRSRGV